MEHAIDRARCLFATVRAAVAGGNLNLACDTARTLAALDLSSAESRDQIQWTWTCAQLAQVEARNHHSLFSDRPRLAVLDYKTLDYTKASRNIGDYLQSLAGVVQIARFQEIDCADGSPIGEWISNLKTRIRPESRITGDHGRLALQIVDRDFSSGRCYKYPTWLLAFGWYMHGNFGALFDFPFGRHIRPIFLSFHVNNKQLLSPDALAYLKMYGPIGCRDWSTVRLLRAAKVEAFFSGCLTLSLGALFGPVIREPNPSLRAALVDYEPEPGEFDGWDIQHFTHAMDVVRDSEIIANLSHAERLLRIYREFDLVATSRLHCYLPCRALGVNVRFRERRLADVRFEGLVNISSEEVNRLRRSLEAKVGPVIAAIASGANEADVYCRWRELCRDELKAARGCREI